MRTKSEVRSQKSEYGRACAVWLLLSGVAAHAAIFGRMIPLIGGATDIALDEARQRLYLTSSVQGLVQVYSFQRSAFQAPIAVDQTPIAVAMSRDGKQLYVTCYDAS